ncbi:pentatricopeptide repeat-containing protein At4g21065-like [Phalaenopsis equestris]|uniref:pentatricopeptide repeat-containing protein At4g21065-like n=1 Tax=Phalaenopsis equestris TaxID=78828 RepID=UPI0009E38FDF|nr:pentatricopeptide repeat-containing protein At4g21065-like [Phalaenopsis equestris]
MLGGFDRRLLQRFRASVARSQWRFHFSSPHIFCNSDDDDSQDPPWTASNHLFHKHPRLLFLERCKSVRCLNPILAYTIVSGLFHNPFVASRILHSSTVISPRNLSLPFVIFSQMSRPNLFSWNAMIKTLAVTPSSSLSLFAEMRRKGVSPDHYTLPCLLSSCTSMDDLDRGRLIHASSFVFGFESNLFMQTRLLAMYMDCGDLVNAQRMFDEMPNRDVVIWTSMISGLTRQGCHEQALEVFSKMRTDDDSIIRPNIATMISAMSACSGLASLNHTKNLHSCFVKTGFEDHVFAGNSLIAAYVKCGSMTCAHQVFDLMTDRDVHSWTAVITGLALNGHGQDAIFLFSRMLRDGLIPDSTTFVAVLSACSHAGLVNEGIEIFESMEWEFGIKPELVHYGCIADLFARTGHLHRAYEFISSMPMEPNLKILGSLLSACSVHGDLKLGELLSRRIDASMSQCRGGASSILSNLYAISGQWEDVMLIRRGRRGEGDKPAGRSWIK